MAYMTIPKYILKHFEPGSQPDRRTVKKWIDSGEIAGRRIGNQYYVDPDVEIVKPVNNLVLKVVDRETP